MQNTVKGNNSNKIYCFKYDLFLTELRYLRMKLVPFFFFKIDYGLFSCVGRAVSSMHVFNKHFIVHMCIVHWNFGPLHR